MAELPVGRRLAYWRNQRGMSQQAFADALGKSKVERGTRRLDKLSNLREIARTLRVDVDVLVGTDTGTEPAAAGPTTTPVGPVGGRELDVLRAALFAYDATLAPPDGAEPDPTGLRRGIGHAWLALQHADYRTLLGTLPGLLRDGHRCRAAHPDDPQACHQLAQGYQLASTVLRKLGDPGLAWLAADRAMTVCRDTDDDALTLSATVHLTRVLHTLGRHRHTVE
ncbi:XRE family transcriptional regulator, partial [Micromonospora fluostatini]